jgi:hypothetical protein
MTTEPTPGPPQRIVLSDIDIPFWRLVAIFTKWALAGVPAAVVLTIILSVIFGIFGMLFDMSSMMRPF